MELIHTKKYDNLIQYNIIELALLWKQNCDTLEKIRDIRNLQKDQFKERISKFTVNFSLFSEFKSMIGKDFFGSIFSYKGTFDLMRLLDEDDRSDYFDRVEKMLDKIYLDYLEDFRERMRLFVYHEKYSTIEISKLFPPPPYAEINKYTKMDMRDNIEYLQVRNGTRYGKPKYSIKLYTTQQRINNKLQIVKVTIYIKRLGEKSDYVKVAFDNYVERACNKLIFLNN
jgi:hypothetical protein